MAEQIVRLPEGAPCEMEMRLDVEGDHDALSGLEVRAPPPVARPVSKVKAPVARSVAHEALRTLGFHLGTAARNGDCFPLSVMAGFEVDAEQAAHPQLEALEAVGDARAAAVDLLVADEIGGITGSVVREHESLPADPAEAELELTDWRQLSHFRKDGYEYCSTAFMFGVAAALERPVIVLETKQGDILDPCMLYAERTAAGLATAPARSSFCLCRKIAMHDPLISLN